MDKLTPARIAEIARLAEQLLTRWPEHAAQTWEIGVGGKPNRPGIRNPDGREAATALTALLAEREELLALLGGIKWKSADRDNMEFAARITYSQMDKILAALKGETP